MYKVADLMSRDVVTLEEDDDLGLAESILGLGRIRHLPVARGETLLGLVTHRDLVRALAETKGEKGRKASEIMRRDVRTVTPTTRLREAAELMLKHKLGCVPVLEDGKLVGILTEADLVRFALEVISEFDDAAGDLERGSTGE
jgi:CBS domain-containing protein